MIAARGSAAVKRAVAGGRKLRKLVAALAESAIADAARRLDLELMATGFRLCRRHVLLKRGWETTQWTELKVNGKWVRL